MPLTISTATPSDARRIAEIHMLAFGSNLLLRAQFPSPSIRLALQNSIYQKALADIHDPWVSVLVVRAVDCSSPDLDEESKVISFSKWHQPVPDEVKYEETPWIWPPGTNLEVLNSWTKSTEVAFEKLLHHRPCFHKSEPLIKRIGLSFLGTDPAYERRGAASLMLRWGIEQCREKNAPAYLESTAEASQLYRGHGFVAEERVEIDLDLVEDGELTQMEKYSEECFVFRP